MPSISLLDWRGWRRDKLDEIKEAHQAVGGSGRGRRYATEQLNYAYAVLLSSHFQGFCRDLHTECVQHIVRKVPDDLQNIIRNELLNNRRLDRGNPNPGNIGADFARLDLPLWDQVNALDRRNSERQRLLEDLYSWRNAIAHQDFDSIKFGGLTTLRLSDVSRWRRACDQLAETFDSVTAMYLRFLLGAHQW
jgi:hypothetical protein